MAEKRPGRASRQRASADAASAAEVERAVTALEDLVLSGRAEDIPRWTSVLWSHRAETQRVLLRRLADGTVRAPALLLEVLVGLSGKQAAPVLRQLAQNPEVGDLVRLEARRRSGWSERGERRARAAFLRTLRDPMGALHGLVAQGCGLPAPDADAFEEALGYVLALGSEERKAWIHRVAGMHGTAVAWLLRALLSARDTGTHEAAIDELLAMRDWGAVAALDRLARGGARGARIAAHVAAQRLGLHAVGVVRAKAADAPAFEEALLTGVDGRGGQAVTVIRAWNPDVRLVLQVMLRDDTGVAAIHGAMRVSRDHTEEMLRLSGLPDAPVVRVSLDEARTQVLWAVERQLAAGRLPPSIFALWEPYLWPDLRPSLGGDIAALALDGPAPPPAPDRVAELLRSGFCESWQFGVQELAPVLRDLAEGSASDPARYGTLLARLCPPPARQALAERLRRQAWVLDRSGRADLRDAALGCACRLQNLAADELDTMPLLRGMLARGLAGLRPRQP